MTSVTIGMRMSQSQCQPPSDIANFGVVERLNGPTVKFGTASIEKPSIDESSAAFSWILPMTLISDDFIAAVYAAVSAYSLRETSFSPIAFITSEENPET